MLDTLGHHKTVVKLFISTGFEYPRAYCASSGVFAVFRHVSCLNTARPQQLQPRGTTFRLPVIRSAFSMADVTPVQHSKDLEQEQAVDQIEVAGTTDASSEEEPLQERMTVKTWLAVGTLALTYMTAFQQGACTAAIVKSIDIALGTHNKEVINLC